MAQALCTYCSLFCGLVCPCLPSPSHFCVSGPLLHQQNLWCCSTNTSQHAYKPSVTMCFAAGPCALSSHYPCPLHSTLLRSQHVFWFVQRVGVVEMMFVIGSVLMLDRLRVQAACEFAAAHIGCLSVFLSVCLSGRSCSATTAGTDHISIFIYL